MIFLSFGGKIDFFAKYNCHCEYFYFLVKFLNWIVIIWVMLARLIGKRGAQLQNEI